MLLSDQVIIPNLDEVGEDSRSDQVIDRCAARFSISYPFVRKNGEENMSFQLPDSRGVNEYNTGPTDGCVFCLCRIF